MNNEKQKGKRSSLLVSEWLNRDNENENLQQRQSELQTTVKLNNWLLLVFSAPRAAK